MWSPGWFRIFHIYHVVKSFIFSAFWFIFPLNIFTVLIAISLTSIKIFPKGIHIICSNGQCVCVCVVGVWPRPGPGLTLVRVPVRSCWMLWSAQETSSSWISVRMASGSSTTVTTWRTPASPAAPTQVHVQHTHTRLPQAAISIHKTWIICDGEKLQLPPCDQQK